MNEINSSEYTIESNESVSNNENSNMELPKINPRNDIELPRLNLKSDTELPRINLKDGRLIDRLNLSNVPTYYPKVKPIELPKIKNPMLEKMDSMDKHLSSINENSEKMLQSIDKLIDVNIANNNISEQYLSEISNKLDSITTNNDKQSIPNQIIEEAKNAVITRGVEYAFTLLLMGLKNSMF